MADVFISYARADQATARKLAQALKAKGFEVWWDAHLPAHRSYSEVIEQRLHSAKAVVVLWSKDSAKSQWVRAEADHGRNAGKLVQAQIDTAMPPMPFNQIQCADLKGWRGGAANAGLAKIVASVGALVSGEDLPEPATEEKPAWWQRPALRWAAAAALLLLVASAFLIPRLIDGGEAERPVLAVLPFKSLDQRDTSLVAGIWEDTRHAISRNPQLLVLGPNTAEQLAGDPKAANKAADYLLEASVRSVGDRIRVNTNLVRTDDGAQLWSENFDRKLDDVFELQTEIANEIEGRIRGRLARGGGKQPENIATSGEVYALYNDARSKIRNREMHQYEDALQQLQRVVQLDPNFAPGWATLAVISAFGLGGGDDVATAESYARKAIALAPNLAAGHAALGFALRKGPVAESALRRAIELDPNDFEALNWLANSMDVSRSAEKLEIYSRIVEIEPLWWPASFNRINLLNRVGGPEAMQKELERLRALGDERLSTLVAMSIAEEKNDFSAAAATGLDYYRSAGPDDREFIGGFLFSILYRLGYLEAGDIVGGGPPPNSYIPYIRTNDPKAITLMEAQHSPRQFWTYGHLAIVGARVYLLNGQGPRLARRYHAAAGSAEEFAALVGDDNFPDVAPGVALALRSAGEHAEANRILALAEKQMPDPRADPLDMDIRLARIYAVQGKTDQAIGLLGSAVRRGWFPPFLPIHTDIALDPPLRELRSDPRFERIRQQILGHIAKERAELGPLRLD